MFSLYDFVVTIKADTSQADAAIESSGQRAGGLAGKFGGLKAAGVAAFAAVGAAGVAATVKIGKTALDSYANFEQLEGGVKKLFGSASKEIMQNAQNAYKTSGMSANQYMEQATSFSASLINSLNGDTQKAAKQTDVAMRAISDNVNTFGSDMASVQYAFQGFAKQNYTMLDNLKLGYGGTKTEMERLIKDANEYAKANGQAADLSINSFSDIVTAIDLIQQKQHVAGTTAKEAAGTISGSIGQVKAAWENLLAGLGNPDANIKDLVSTLTTSIGTAAKNIIPAIGQIAKGFAEASKTLIPQMISMIVEGLPDMVEVGGKIIQALIQGLATAIPQIIEALPQMLEIGVQMIDDIIKGITDAIPKIALAIAEHAGEIIAGGVNIILAIVQGLIKAIPKIIEALPKIVRALVKGLVDNGPKILEAGVKLIVALVKGVVKAIPKLIAAAPKIVAALARGVIQLAGKLISAGAELVKNIITGIGNWIGKVVDKGKELISKVWQAIKNGVKKFLSIGTNIVKGIWNGISNGFTWIKNKIKEWVGNVVDFFKKVLGIDSPSKVFRNEVGRYISEGLALGIMDGQGDVEDALDNLVPDYAVETSAVGGGLEDMLRVSVGGAVTSALGELTPILQQGMVDAMDGIQVKLNSRNFGKLTREAVNGAI